MQGYQPTAKLHAYESPKVMACDVRPMRKPKDDVLPPIPTEDVSQHRKDSDDDYDRGMELGNLKALPAPRFSALSYEAVHPAAGLRPIQTSPSRDRLEASAETQTRNPFDTASLGDNREYNPTSPLSPQRTYSPFSPTNYTKYTTSPFIDSPSRQPSPFSSAASMRTISYVPPHPSYVGYSPTSPVPPTPSLLDEPKSPYRAFSPRLMSRHEFSAPTPPLPAVVDPPAAMAPREVSALNHEPLELGTSFNMRPQSLVDDEHHNPAIRELSSHPKAPIPHDMPEHISQSGMTSREPHINALSIPPQELPTRNSFYEADAPPSITTSAAPSHPMQTR